MEEKIAKTIFITGSKGLLGSFLVPLLSTKHVVIQPTHEQFDITKPNFSLIKNVDIAINLAAYTNVQGAEQNKEEAFRVNCNGVDWLLNLNNNIEIYHISTDYVYDLNTKNSKETDLLKPFCVYGESKAAGDTKLLSYCRQNMHIIRTSFKPIAWKHQTAYTNVLTNADTVDVISRMIANFILLEPPGGVYNLGTETKTIYELAKKNNKEILPSKKSEYEFVDVTMDLERYKTILNKNKT